MWLTPTPLPLHHLHIWRARMESEEYAQYNDDKHSKTKWIENLPWVLWNLKVGRILHRQHYCCGISASCGGWKIIEANYLFSQGENITWFFDSKVHAISVAQHRGKSKDTGNAISIECKEVVSAWKAPIRSISRVRKEGEGDNWCTGRVEPHTYIHTYTLHIQEKNQVERPQLSDISITCRSRTQTRLVTPYYRIKTTIIITTTRGTRILLEDRWIPQTTYLSRAWCHAVVDIYIINK